MYFFSPLHGFYSSHGRTESRCRRTAPILPLRARSRPSSQGPARSSRADSSHRGGGFSPHVFFCCCFFLAGRAESQCGRTPPVFTPPCQVTANIAGSSTLPARLNRADSSCVFLPSMVSSSSHGRAELQRRRTAPVFPPPSQATTKCAVSSTLAPTPLTCKTHCGHEKQLRRGASTPDFDARGIQGGSRKLPGLEQGSRIISFHGETSSDWRHSSLELTSSFSRKVAFSPHPGD